MSRYEEPFITINTKASHTASFYNSLQDALIEEPKKFFESGHMFHYEAGMHKTPSEPF